jgi:hypothetical protein
LGDRPSGRTENIGVVGFMHDDANKLLSP